MNPCPWLELWSVCEQFAIFLFSEGNIQHAVSTKFGNQQLVAVILWLFFTIIQCYKLDLTVIITSILMCSFPTCILEVENSIITTWEKRWLWFSILIQWELQPFNKCSGCLLTCHQTFHKFSKAIKTKGKRVTINNNCHIAHPSPPDPQNGLTLYLPMCSGKEVPSTPVRGWRPMGRGGGGGGGGGMSPVL